MSKFQSLLSGGDQRSIGLSNLVVSQIHNQHDFDELFMLIDNNARMLAMRAADAVEKASAGHPQYLASHREKIFSLSINAVNKELKWHLALLLPRLKPEGKDFKNAWHILSSWAREKANSKIVRVNALQGLYELVTQNSSVIAEFKTLILDLEKENLPSMNARIKIIKGEMFSLLFKKLETL